MARGEIVKTKGFCLKAVPYKETSYIATFLTQEGYLSFKASGIRKKGGHNQANFEEMAASEIVLKEGRAGGYRFQEGNLLFFPQGELMYLLSYRFLAEVLWIISPGIEGDVLYPLVKETVNLLKEKNSPTSILPVFFAKILSLLGYGLVVDHCLFCKEKHNIVSLSYKDGGFLCEKENSTSPRQGQKYLEVAYFAFKVPLASWKGQSLPFADSLAFFKDLVLYFEDTLGKKIKIFSYLYSSLKEKK